ncbi:MAG: sulfite exporter TauE/SafE family protein [Bradyrhizobium sp.]|nr:sulfite exporter TauE/SafE family protein [Bradyrhizobium sp.]
MEGEALRQAVEAAGPLALAIALVAGLAFSFNPVALAAIPVALAYVTKARRPEQAAVFGTAFVAAMLATHIFLGAVAGVGGSWIEAAIGNWWNLAIGPLLIVLGLMWPGWVRIPLPAFALRAKRPSGPLGAVLFGAVFSVAICPICTPALLVLIGVALASGSPLFGGLLLLAFAVGRAIPVAAGTWMVGWAWQRPRLAAWRRGFEIAGGLVLVMSGFYLLNAYFFWLPSLAI